MGVFERLSGSIFRKEEAGHVRQVHRRVAGKLSIISSALGGIANPELEQAFISASESLRGLQLSHSPVHACPFNILLFAEKVYSEIDSARLAAPEKAALLGGPFTAFLSECLSEMVNCQP